MGKASKWFRAFLGLKKPDTSSPTTSFPNPLKEKRGWSFVKSYREKDNHHAITTTIPGEGDKTATASDVMVQPSEHLEGLDLDKHAIAVAAATAVMAEAAVAAARAAAPVVRLSSSARCDSAAAMTAPYVAGGIEIREEWAAVKIQAAFRGCLARKALRALRGLVKLQALVRGHIERKRMAEWLQRMQALFDAQIMRTTSYLSANSSNLHLPSPQTPEKFESPIRSKSMKYDQSLTLKRNGSKSHAQIIDNQDNCWNLPDSRVDEHSWIRQRSSMRISRGDDERSVKILEIDSGKAYFKQRCSNLFHSTLHALDSDQRSQSLTNSKDSTTHQSNRSPYCGEVQSYTRLVADDTEESPYCTVNNSPQIYSASSMNGSRRSPFIPSKSDGSGSCLSGYYEHPNRNYMACTESSMAKVRSRSAPKQRPYDERYGSSNRFSVHGYGELRLSSQSTSVLQPSFTNKAYPVSGRLDKLGMPMGCRH